MTIRAGPALARVRSAQAGRRFGVALGLGAWAKQRVLEAPP